MCRNAFPHDVPETTNGGTAPLDSLLSPFLSSRHRGLEASSASQDVAETLIEELGHAYDLTTGSGGSSIAYDNPLVVGFTPGKTNYTTIIQDCNK